MFREEIKRLIPDNLSRCKTIDTRYKQIKKLGEGRYGKVFLCFDQHLENLVAMKTLRPANLEIYLRNFLNEVITLARISSFDSGLKSPNIIDFNLNGRDDEGELCIYYVMEYIEMGELYAVLDPIEMISERLACFFFRQLCDSLTVLHLHNLLHLDLKPENVLMDASGNLYLCDFGSSAFIYRDEGNTGEKIIGGDQTGVEEGLKSSVDSNSPKRQIKNNKKTQKVKPVIVNLKTAGMNFNQKEFASFLRNTRFVITSEFAAPEITEFENCQELLKQERKAKIAIEVPNPSKLDVFSLGVLLFYVVLKCRPFESASLADEYFKRLTYNKEAFWKIFSKVRVVSKEFKDIIGEMLQNLNPNRIDLLGLSVHAWVLRYFPTPNEYQISFAQINARKRAEPNKNSIGDNKDCRRSQLGFGLNGQLGENLPKDTLNHKSAESYFLNQDVSLVEELNQVLAARRIRILEEIESEFHRKEQQEKNKRVKVRNSLKTGHYLFINQFLQKHQSKIQAMRKFLSSESCQSIESLLSSGSESSLSGGDGGNF